MRKERIFDVFFEQELRPLIKDLDTLKAEQWEKAKKAMLKNGLIALAVAAVVLLLALRSPGAFPVAIFFALICVGISVAFGYTGYTKDYSEAFKAQLINKMVGNIDENLSYAPSSSISREEYFDSKLFTKGVDRFKGDDLVTGTIDKTDIRFSELHTEYKSTTTDSKGRRKTTWHTIFKGIFFIGDFHKDFKTTTVCLPDYAENFFGGLFKSFQSANRKGASLIQMDHPQFEKYFKVYADDAVEAHYLLTPGMMERIVELREEYDHDMYIAFVDGHINIAVSVPRNLFEAPNLWFKGDLQPLLKEYNHYLELGKEIVEQLNLNLRIWSKQ